MTRKLLQIDFPMDGPWGAGMTQAYSDLAQKIAKTPGLIWKIWTENPRTRESGGIYLFENDATLNAFLTEHTAQLRSLGIESINAKQFDVNESLTQITRGKLD